MNSPLVNISSLTLHHSQKTVVREMNWLIQKGENWLLSGESGSGKTTLAKAIAGKHPIASGELFLLFDSNSELPKVVSYVDGWYSFKNLEGQTNFYYQQRFIDKQVKEVITVEAELAQFGQEYRLDANDLIRLIANFEFFDQLPSQLIELSSGEHKKLQLIKAFWLKPQLLILDQPYIGLDNLSRQNLNNLLDEATIKGVQYILITDTDRLPESVNRYAIITDQHVQVCMQRPESPVILHPNYDIPSFLKQAPAYSHGPLVKMTNIKVVYGKKKILHQITWQINSGERWLIQGRNGSGKSTLLSLINGDHPQSYANELHLFGKRRGSGESIWDIKEKIGMISPEFHWYFDTSSTVWQSVASGFYDTVGLFQQLPYSKQIQVDELLRIFGLLDDKHKLINTLSLGKQRVALLARTIIKNPALLILDEPCQGLDREQTQHFNGLVDEICTNGMTLIYVGHFESQLPKKFTHHLVLQEGRVASNTRFYENELAL